MMRVCVYQYLDHNSTLLMLHELSFSARLEHLNQPKPISKLYLFDIFNQDSLYYESLNKFFNQGQLLSLHILMNSNEFFFGYSVL